MVASDLGKERTIRLGGYLFHVKLRVLTCHTSYCAVARSESLMAEGGCLSSNVQYEAGKH